MFLGKYKMMLGADCKRIYRAMDYHRKRLKVLEKERYIKRVSRTFIKLDDKWTKLVKAFGYDYSFTCMRKAYMDRVKEVARIAGLTIDSNIEFIASWDLKKKKSYTQMSRNYLGKMIYQRKEIIVYYIAKNKDENYTYKTMYDIQKLIEYENVIIFMENIEILNNRQKFIFDNKSTTIIQPTDRNLLILRELEEIDFYDIVKQIYPNTEILLSNLKEAEYMTEENEYIVIMPFIDTEKIYKLNIFYKNNSNTDKKISIMTLKENKEKIEQILINKANIIQIDNCLESVNERCKLDILKNV